MQYQSETKYNDNAFGTHLSLEANAFTARGEMHSLLKRNVFVAGDEHNCHQSFHLRWRRLLQKANTFIAGDKHVHH